MSVQSKLSSTNFAFLRAKNQTSAEARLSIFHALFASHIRFGAIIYSATNQAVLKPLEIMYNKVLRNLDLQKYNGHTYPICKCLEVLDFGDLITSCKVVFMHNIHNMRVPNCLLGLVQYKKQLGHARTRQEYGSFHVPPTK